MILLIAAFALGQSDVAALGAPRWADREAAERRLDAGRIEDALPCLESKDPEVRRRALRSIRRKDPCPHCKGAAIIPRWIGRDTYEDVPCPSCDGYGSPWLRDRLFRREKLCPNCSGAGKQLWTEAMAQDGIEPGLHPCPHCKGSGFR